MGAEELQMAQVSWNGENVGTVHQSLLAHRAQHIQVDKMGNGSTNLGRELCRAILGQRKNLSGMFAMVSRSMLSQEKLLISALRWTCASRAVSSWSWIYRGSAAWMMRGASLRPVRGRMHQLLLIEGEAERLLA